eukprot:scaffold59759_cov18-Tisochrysis_lutea.AAC.1
MECRQRCVVCTSKLPPDAQLGSPGVLNTARMPGQTEPLQLILHSGFINDHGVLLFASNTQVQMKRLAQIGSMGANMSQHFCFDIACKCYTSNLAPSTKRHAPHPQAGSLRTASRSRLAIMAAARRGACEAVFSKRRSLQLCA